MYPKIRWDMYYAKFLGTGLRNRGALPRFFSIHEAITKKISVHTFFIKKILYTFGGNQRICKPARPQMTGLPTMAGWSWAAPNGPEDFPAQKYPRCWNFFYFYIFFSSIYQKYMWV